MRSLGEVNPDQHLMQYEAHSHAACRTVQAPSISEVRFIEWPLHLQNPNPNECTWNTLRFIIKVTMTDERYGDLKEGSRKDL